MTKTQEQITHEYLLAANVHDWVELEYRDYFGVGLPIEEAKVLGEQAFERAAVGVDTMMTQGAYDSGKLSSVLILGEQDGRQTLEHLVEEMPAPEALLLFLAENFRVGDYITVYHRYVNGRDVPITAKWPFGIETAIEMTTNYAYSEVTDEYQGGVEYGSNEYATPNKDIGDRTLKALRLVGVILVSLMSIRSIEKVISSKCSK